MTGGIAGPSVWAVSDGRAGIERQSLSLARALCAASRWSAMPHMRSDDCRAGPVRLQPGGLQLLLPPDRWPAPLAALPPSQRNLFKPPWPDVWIASGRRSIPYSRLVKKWSGGTTFVVQTQYPKVGMEPFDLVIAPEHDEVRGANVLSILGPPTFFSEEEVEDARLRFGDLAAHPGLKLLVSIGGDSKTHRMTGARIGEIEAALGELSGQGVRLWITVSRRTPALGRARLRAFADIVGAIFWDSPATDGPNPYLAFLALCDAALVTEDSANLIADPAYFGKPVHLLRLEGGSDRFDRLHAGFIARGAAKWFDGMIETWAYEPIREVERAADEIVRRLLERRLP